MYQKTITALLLVMLLNACATTPAPHANNEVHLSPQTRVVIPAYYYPGRAREVSQLVTAHYDDKHFVFEAHISITPERFLMVGLDPFGRKALTINWDAQGVTYETAPWVPSELHPENILADIIVLYWPQASVRALLATSDVTLISDAHSRSIRVNDREIIHVGYEHTSPKNLWSGIAHYENHSWRYALDIRSVEVEVK